MVVQLLDGPFCGWVGFAAHVKAELLLLIFCGVVILLGCQVYVRVIVRLCVAIEFSDDVIHIHSTHVCVVVATQVHDRRRDRHTNLRLGQAILGLLPRHIHP